MPEREVVDIEVLVQARLPKAIRVRLHEDASGVWLPLSQIEVDPEDVVSGKATITVPIWLAEREGLV